VELVYLVQVEEALDLGRAKAGLLAQLPQRAIGHRLAGFE